MDSKSGKTAGQKAEVDRRAFFKTATLGLGAGVAATAIETVAGDPAEAAAPEDTGKSRYRLTDHVRRAYALARF